MTKDKAQIVRGIFSIIFTVMSIVVAILLIVQVCDIYLSGIESPYTVEAIKEHFDKIAPAIYVWLALIVVGFVLWEVFPEKKKIGKTSLFYSFENIQKKLNGKIVCESEESKQFAKNQLVVNVVKLVVGVAVGICSVVSLVYLCDSANFANANQNKEIVDATLYLLPFLVVSFVLLIGVCVFEWCVLKKQLPLAKTLLKNAQEDDNVSKSRFEEIKEKCTAFFENKNTILGIRIAVAVLGIVLLIYGAASGGSDGVLAKAIAICRQCIGLG